MRRHWQHTSFCMGQCVSSCGSKRTLDSVPTTPDTENYPGIIPSAKIIHRKNSSSDVTTIEDQDVLAFKQKQRRSAAKFVTAFSQRRIAARTRRINPEGESPVHIIGKIPSSSSPVPSLKIPFLQTSDSVTYHHGDMKDSTVKNYFRGTISSAKKTSTKSVTFSEVSPAKPSTLKKSFFSFSKPNTKKTSEGTEPASGSTPSRSLSKVLSRKRSKDNVCTPTPLVKPLKEKQVCRVTFSPKRGTTLANVEQRPHSYSSICESDPSKQKSNGDEREEPKYCSRTSTSSNPAMGNASSSSQGLVVEAVKTIKPIVKPNSTSRNKFPNVDVNENNTKTPYTLSVKKSGSDSPGLIRTDSKKRHFGPVNKNETSSSSGIRNLNSIKEENRLLRLKFFLEDSSENSTSPLDISSSDGDSFPGTTLKMNRQNLFNNNKSSIPLPNKSTANKSGNSASSIPKLYSIPSVENEVVQKSTIGYTNSRIKPVLKPEPAQPTNMGSGKWVPAADFFEQSSHTNAEKQQSHTSPSTSSRSVRRTSEPPRWISPNSVVPSKSIRDAKRPDLITERRGTTIGFHKKVPVAQNTGNVSKIAKPVTMLDKNAGPTRANPLRVGIKKPEETKPFYTIGLYQNRPKPAEATKTFGVHQTGFHGVSTGIVRQRTQQYQSKVGDTSNVPRLHPPQNDSNTLDKKGKETQSPSPNKPGVVRSATYTIRKHPLSEEDGGASGEHNENSKPVVKAKSDADRRYLTWTVRKPGKMAAGSVKTLADNVHREMKQAQKEQTYHMDERMSSDMHSPSGYPLQHNPSGASTSSMGTNDDCTGDHVAISDSEYLIDDEISDQPDLTLTFKDSSLKLSSSSSGESLLSDIMLDHLDLNQERVLGELTSDSAISDISSHKPVSKGSCDQILKLSENSRVRVFEQSCNKGLEKANSSNEIASPSSTKTVRHLKSPRRTSKPVVTVAKSTGQYDVNTSRSSSCTVKSSSSASIKYRTTPDKKQTPSNSSQEKHQLFQKSSSLSPLHRNKTLPKEKVVGLTIENVSKLHKQYELADSQCSIPDEGKSLPVPFAEELLVEFQGLKDELEKLRLQLETQEHREREKDELILRLSSEVERLKSGQLLDNCKDGTRSLISSRLSGGEDISSEKERYINCLNYENAAVQTENNNLFNRAVSYPEEDDKYGELVSFRIGRSSSLKKKL